MLPGALGRHVRMARLIKEVFSAKVSVDPATSKERGKQLRDEVPFEAQAV